LGTSLNIPPFLGQFEHVIRTQQCPESKFRVTPEEACSGPNFFDGKQTLKRNHQVQGQLGATQCKWCDFIVYKKESHMIIWASVKNKLKNYYFDTLFPQLLQNFVLNQSTNNCPVV